MSFLNVPLLTKEVTKVQTIEGWFSNFQFSTEMSSKCIRYLSGLFKRTVFIHSSDFKSNNWPCLYLITRFKRDIECMTFCTVYTKGRWTNSWEFSVLKPCILHSFQCMRVKIVVNYDFQEQEFVLIFVFFNLVQFKFIGFQKKAFTEINKFKRFSLFTKNWKPIFMLICAHNSNTKQSFWVWRL